MINIVCLKWGDKYGPEYVNRLFYAIDRNTILDYRFWCLTEDSQGIDPRIKILPLKNSEQLDSWWNKLCLFDGSNGLPVGEQIFYVDLDTLIVGNINSLLRASAPKIIMLKDFYWGIAKSASRAASGLMSWRHGHYDHVWKKFIKDPSGAVKSVAPHGDQRWIEGQINCQHFWQDLFPNQVVSFKMHCNRGIPPGASIICYHGRPSIPESAVSATRDYKWRLEPQPWVLDHWKDQ